MQQLDLRPVQQAAFQIVAPTPQVFLDGAVLHFFFYLF
jgi:hypothetical protein